MKWLWLLLLTGACLAQELPDAPVPQPKAHYFTFGDQHHSLRSNHETLHDPHFYGPQVAVYASIAADITRNRHMLYGCCGRPMLHGPGLYADALIPAAVGTALSYVADRFWWRPLNQGTAGYFIFRHTQSTVTGQYH